MTSGYMQTIGAKIRTGEWDTWTNIGNLTCCPKQIRVPASKRRVRGVCVVRERRFRGERGHTASEEECRGGIDDIRSYGEYVGKNKLCQRVSDIVRSKAVRMRISM